MTREELIQDLERRAVAHQKLARIFTRQGNHTDANAQYRIARLLMGITDRDQEEFS